MHRWPQQPVPGAWHTNLGPYLLTQNSVLGQREEGSSSSISQKPLAQTTPPSSTDVQPQLDWASQIGTEPPQTYPRLQSHSPLAALQHCPWELHVSPVSQVLQALPQPSEPQPFLKQSGRQMHWPWGPHASFWPLQNPLNGPHRPPHPSEPHSLPVQSGVHVHLPSVHDSLASH
jgi:hypothetical protein